MTAPTAPSSSASQTAKDLMHAGCECVEASDTVATAAAKMRQMDVGALPVCGDDGKLAGMVTDRDIVVECCAEGKDLTRCTCGELAAGRPAYVDAGASVTEALDVMEEHRVRRVPVIEDHRLVGMISESDLAKGEVSDEQLAHFCREVYSGPGNSGGQL